MWKGSKWCVLCLWRQDGKAAGHWANLQHRMWIRGKKLCLIWKTVRDRTPQGHWDRNPGYAGCIYLASGTQDPMLAYCYCDYKVADHDYLVSFMGTVEFTLIGSRLRQMAWFHPLEGNSSSEDRFTFASAQRNRNWRPYKALYTNSEI